MDCAVLWIPLGVLWALLFVFCYPRKTCFSLIFVFLYVSESTACFPTNVFKWPMF